MKNPLDCRPPKVYILIQVAKLDGVDEAHENRGRYRICSAGPVMTAGKIQIECDLCGQRARVNENAAGQNVKCPKCGEDIEVPLLLKEEDFIDAKPQRRANERPRKVRPQQPVRPGASPSRDTEYQPFIRGIACLFAMYIGGLLLVSLFSTADPDAMQMADELWQDGKKAKAVEIYVAEINEGQANDDAEVLKRTIEHYYEIGDHDQVNHFCKIAIDSGTTLTLSPKGLLQTHNEIQKEIDRKESEKKAAELAERKRKEKERLREQEKQKNERRIAAERRKKEHEKELARAKVREEASRLESNQVMVWTAAELEIPKHLTSPSTASFGGIFDYQNPTTCVKPLGKDAYLVKGWVDSQNIFGATIRKNFAIMIYYKTGADYWRVGKPIFLKR